MMLKQIWVCLGLLVNSQMQALPPQRPMPAPINSITITPEMLRDIAAQVPRPIKQHYLNRSCCNCCGPSLYHLYRRRDPVRNIQRKLANQEALPGPDVLKTLALLRLGYLHQPELQNQIAQSLNLQISDSFETRIFYPRNTECGLLIECPTIKITDPTGKQQIGLLFSK